MKMICTRPAILIVCTARPLLGAPRQKKKKHYCSSEIFPNGTKKINYQKHVTSWDVFHPFSTICASIARAQDAATSESKYSKDVEITQEVKDFLRWMWKGQDTMGKYTARPARILAWRLSFVLVLFQDPLIVVFTLAWAVILNTTIPLRNSSCGRVNTCFELRPRSKRN